MVNYSLFLIFGLLLCSLKGYGVWNPEFHIERQQIKSEHIKALRNWDLYWLKQNVIKQSANTWCPVEKTNLIMDLIALHRPKVCVEIGVFNGGSFLAIAATLKHHVQEGHVYGIDPWSNEEATRFMEEGDPNKPWWSEVDLSTIYEQFTQMLEAWQLNSHCTILRTTSAKAAAQIGKIDFLHLDGNYSNACSLQDAIDYLPKVNKGGYILLSNLLTNVNGKRPKIDSFDYLMKSCEFLCEIEKNNSMLLRKIVD